jgi:hypothetical protein
MARLVEQRYKLLYKQCGKSHACEIYLGVFPLYIHVMGFT